MVLLLTSFNMFTTVQVVTAKSELYQIEWFHSDSVNIESILCEARYCQKNLSKQILMIETLSSDFTAVVGLVDKLRSSSEFMRLWLPFSLAYRSKFV